mgnify:CR=1 FL=1
MKSKPKVKSKSESKLKSSRDTLIIVAVLVVVGGGYLWINRPEKEVSAEFNHPQVEGMDNKMMGATLNLPTDYEGLVMLGNQTMDQQNFPLAAESYRRALAIKGDDPHVRTDYGACPHGMGLAHRALEEFATVLEQHPEHALANFNMGIVYYNEKQFDSAKVYWEKYLAIEPDGQIAPTVRQYLNQLDG